MWPQFLSKFQLKKLFEKFANIVKNLIKIGRNYPVNPVHFLLLCYPSKNIGRNKCEKLRPFEEVGTFLFPSF